MNESWTIGDLVEALIARSDSDAIISVRGEAMERRSAAAIGRAANQVARGLIRAGFRPREAAGIYGPNSAEWVIIRFAVGLAGGIAVGIDDVAPPTEAAAIVRIGECRFLFSTRQHLAELGGQRLDPGLRCYAMDVNASSDGVASWTELLTKPEDETPLPRLESDAPAMLLFTSGTTGTPKSFYLTSRNIAANVQAMLSLNLVGPEDRVLLPLPLHHAYPFVVGLITVLSAGAAVVFPEGATARPIQQALITARVTSIVGVPRLYTALLAGMDARVAAKGRVVRLILDALMAVSRTALRAANWRLGRTIFAPIRRQIGPDLRLLISGGAKLDGAATWRLEALGWEVFSGYGLAETASVFTGNRPGFKRIGSEGTPLCGELRIADPDASGMGEIRLKGPSVFSGYLRNDAANREAFTADGWFRTGDLGHCDKDGFLYVTGRSKEMIVLGGGKNIFPEDLEAIYGASKVIREIALLERNGALVALVLPDPEGVRAAGGGSIESAVRVALAEAQRELPAYQRLAGFVLVRSPLPRTRLGKYRRYLLPEIYEKALKGEVPAPPAELSDEDRALIEASPAREIWQILKRRYAARAPTLDSNPQLDLGVDSLEAMALVLEIEARLGLRVDEEIVAAAASVRELLRAASSAAVQAPVSRGKEAVRPGDLAPIEPPSPALAMLGRALLALNRVVLRALFGLSARGLEHLPPAPFVVTPNHASDLDPLAVAAALPGPVLRRTYWGGVAGRLFGGPIRRAISRSAHIFPVDDRRPGATLALALEVVKRGNVLIWFPEEWRSPTGELQPFRPGIGHILHETGAQAVPAFIRGAYEAMPRGRRIPRLAKIEVVFGPPCSPKELAERGTGASEAERIANGLRAKVVELAAERPGAGGEARAA